MGLTKLFQKADIHVCHKIVTDAGGLNLVVRKPYDGGKFIDLDLTNKTINIYLHFQVENF